MHKTFLLICILWTLHLKWSNSFTFRCVMQPNILWRPNSFWFDLAPKLQAATADQRQCSIILSIWLREICIDSIPATDARFTQPLRDKFPPSDWLPPYSLIPQRKLTPILRRPLFNAMRQISTRNIFVPILFCRESRRSIGSTHLSLIGLENPFCWLLVSVWWFHATSGYGAQTFIKSSHFRYFWQHEIFATGLNGKFHAQYWLLTC